MIMVNDTHVIFNIKTLFKYIVPIFVSIVVLLLFRHLIIKLPFRSPDICLAIRKAIKDVLVGH